MNKINFIPFPGLFTKQYHLRQLSLDDQEEIFILRSDERVLEHLDIQKADTIEDARNFIIKINNGINNNESIYWAICRTGNPKLVGTICLWNISQAESKADIGFALLPEFQGNGIMQEVIPAVLDYGFNTMNLKKIDGEVTPANIKSIKLMERFGFKYEFELENTFIYSLKKSVV